ARQRALRWRPAFALPRGRDTLRHLAQRGPLQQRIAPRLQGGARFRDQPLSTIGGVTDDDVAAMLQLAARGIDAIGDIGAAFLAGVGVTEEHEGGAEAEEKDS